MSDEKLKVIPVNPALNPVDPVLIFAFCFLLFALTYPVF
jgi:hypothetical protein